MPVGTDVGLGAGDTVLDGDPAPPRKGAQQLPHGKGHTSPTFRPMSVVASATTYD